MSWHIRVSSENCPNREVVQNEDQSIEDFNICWHLNHPDDDNGVGFPRCNEKDCPMKIKQTDTVDQEEVK